LTPESGTFVDVIHTQALMIQEVFSINPSLGDMHQMGHADFYPQGGSGQTGCDFLGGVRDTLIGNIPLPGALCSHKRSHIFFLHSIFEPNLFPSRECISVEACSKHKTVSNEIVSYMGHRSQDYWTPGERKLYFVDIKQNYWDYYEHN